MKSGFVIAWISLLSLQTIGAETVQRHKVIVIGSGWAGISAAMELRDRGLKEFIVLEKEDRAGGRVSTVASSDGKFVYDMGPQYIISHYERVYQMMFRGGSNPAWDLQPINPFSGIMRKVIANNKGREQSGDYVITFNNLEPSSMYYEGLLSEYEALKAAIGYWDAVKELWPAVPELPAGSPTDFRQWAKFDTADGLAWADKNYGEAGAHYLLDSFFRATFFQGLDKVSKAAVYWVIANTHRKDAWLVPTQGMQVLLDGMAARLAPMIKFSQEVESIERQGRDSYLVTLSDGRQLEAESLIVAVPAPVAKKLFKNDSFLSPLQRQYLQTKFIPTIVVNVELPASLTKDLPATSYKELYSSRRAESVSSVVIPTSTRSLVEPIAGFSVESGKGRFHPNKTEVFGIHMDEERARLYWNASDADISSKVLEQLAYILELGLDEVMAAKPVVKIKKHPYAVSSLEVGRATFLEKFWREQLSKDFQVESGIRFVGDGTSFPTIGAAADSGQQGARAILRRFNRLVEERTTNKLSPSSRRCGGK